MVSGADQHKQHVTEGNLLNAGYSEFVKFETRHTKLVTPTHYEKGVTHCMGKGLIFTEKIFYTFPV